jgi:hypothetical protein
VVHQEFTIPETYANGTTLIFQVVEEYNLLTRYSDLVGGTVYVPEVTTMVNGSFEWYTDVTVRASNLFDGGTVYYYVGESYGPSTFGGHDLTISGNVQLISSFVNTSATADVDFSILDSYPDGTNLYFQVVEEYSILTRYSNLSGGTVTEPTTFELFNSGNTAGAQMGLRAVGALPGAVVNFYGTLNSTIDPVDGALISSAVTGSGGSATININVPASMSGATAYLRARDMTNGEKTQILTVMFL